jgi:hypothetical protein
MAKRQNTKKQRPRVGIFCFESNISVAGKWAEEIKQVGIDDVVIHNPHSFGIGYGPSLIRACSFLFGRNIAVLVIPKRMKPEICLKICLMTAIALNNVANNYVHLIIALESDKGDEVKSKDGVKVKLSRILAYLDKNIKNFDCKDNTHYIYRGGVDAVIEKIQEICG